MKKKSILTILVILFSLTGCENEIDYLAKDKKPTLVLNALINAESVENYIYVNMTGKANITEVKDATVEVYINDELKEIAKPIEIKSNKDKGGYLIKSHFNVGDIIKLNVITKDRLYNAWAEVKVPTHTTIDKIDTATVKLKDEYNRYNNFLKYKITFKDKNNEKSFYRLLLDKNETYITINNDNVEETTEKKYNQNMIIREDVVLTDGTPTSQEEEEIGLFAPVDNKYTIFDDSRFTNTSYTMTVSVYKENEGTIPLNIKSIKTTSIVRLISISEIEYNYLRALNMFYSDQYNDIISEPIRFPSNVNGGTGIVSISSESSKRILIREKYNLKNKTNKQFFF